MIIANTQLDGEMNPNLLEIQLTAFTNILAKISNIAPIIHIIESSTFSLDCFIFLIANKNTQIEPVINNTLSVIPFSILPFSYFF